MTSIWGSDIEIISFAISEINQPHKANEPQIADT